MRRFAALVALAVLATAAPVTGGSIAGAAGAAVRIPRGDRLVIQASTGGGFVPVDIARNQYPELTITGRGEVLTLGPTTLQYPPNALPNVQVATISRARVRALVARAEQIGLLDDEHGDYGQPQITDHASTTVTVVANGERSTTSVYALGDDGDDLSDEQRDNRAALRKFLDEAGRGTPTAEYEPTALAVLAWRADGAGEDDTKAWPLAEPPVVAAGDGYGPGCTLLTDADLAAVLEAAASASTQTVWTSGSDAYELAFHPLLPYEHTCEDVLG